MPYNPLEYWNVVKLQTNQTSGVAVLGEMAVQQRLVTPDQLKVCLAEQETLRKAGRNVPIGQIFIKRHLLTAEQVREILLGQKGISNTSHLVNGKYALVRKLGQGGAGEVYLARDTSLDRPVAIKILREEMSPNRKAVERFVREAKILAKIRHPHIVSVHETGRYQDRNYFVMDYVDGKPLDVFIGKGTLPLQKRVELLAKISGAVGEVHRHGVVHRDLKPSNILISPDGNPFLLDFGLARDSSRVTKLTVSGTILGTPFYMAPEQVEGKPVDSRTDVYGLGVLIYESATGRLPFRADNDFELYRKISSHDPPTPSTINRRVPRDLEVICLKAMDKDPRRRYADAGDLASDLQRYLDGVPIVARRVSIPVRIFRRVKEHRILASGVAGSLLVGVIALGFLLTSHLRENSRITTDLEAGDRSFSAGRLIEAKEAYNRVHGLDPDNRTAADGLVKIRERQGNIKSRLSEATRIMDRDPVRSAEIFAAVLELDTRNSAAREGIKLAKDREERNATRRLHSEFLSATHERIMKFESDYTLPPDDYLIRDRTPPLLADLAALEKAVKLLDSDQKADAFYLMGRIQSHLGQSTAAIASLDAAIETSPLGRYYYHRGNLALARYRNEYMRRSAKFLPAEKRNTLLEELSPLRHQAREDFVKAIDSGSVEIWQAQFAQAVLFYTAHRYREAEQECRKVIRTHRNAEVLKLLGQSALDRAISDPALYRDAIDWFRRATNIYRSDYEAYAGLATAYYQQALDLPGHTFNTASIDRAVEQYDTALRLRREAPLLLSRGRALLTKAEWLQMTGQESDDVNELAFVDIRDARDMSPGDPVTHNWIAITLIQTATGLLFRSVGTVDAEGAEVKIDDALMALKESIRLDPASETAHHNRAVAYGMRCYLDMLTGKDPAGSIENAKNDIAKSIELGSESGSLYVAKGLNHFWKCISLLSDLESGRNQAETIVSALAELDDAVDACDIAVVRLHRKPDLANTFAMRGLLRTMKGLYGFFLGNREECTKSMRAASEDFEKAGKLVDAYRIYDSKAFVNVRKAMELQLEGKDPAAEYRFAREGLTELLTVQLPKDKNAHVMRLFCLLYRGFANYYLDLPGEAIADWTALTNAIPPFGSFLRPWIKQARQKIREK